MLEHVISIMESAFLYEYCRRMNQLNYPQIPDVNGWLKQETLSVKGYLSENVRLYKDSWYA